MTIRNRLLILAFLPIIVLIVIGSGSLLVRQQLVDSFRAREMTDDITLGVFDLNLLTGDYVQSHLERAEVQWQVRYQSVGDTISRVQVTSVEGQLVLDRLRSTHEGVGALFSSLVVSTREARPHHEEIAETLASELFMKSQNMVTDCSILANIADEELLNAQQQAAYVFWPTLILAVLGGVAISMLIYHSIAKPVRELTEGAEIAGTGNLDYKVGTSAKDEIGALSRAFDQMTANLKATTASRDELAVQVSERTRAERKSKESKEGYRKLIETSPYAIFVHIDQKIIFMNPAGLELLGAHNSSEIIGKSIFDVTHPDYLEVVKRRQELLEKGEAPRNQYIKALRLDGSVIDVELTTTRVTYQGKPAIMSIATDITERKQAEGKLKESEEGYRKLIETSPYTIFVHIDQKIVFMNPAGLELLGAHNSSEIIGKSIFDITHPDYLEVIERRQELLKKGEAPRSEYFRAIRLDGSVIDCEITAARRVTYQGESAIMATIRDVTDRIKAEAKLQQYLENLEVVVKQRTNELTTVNKELEAFAYSVSHDLRAPLRHIDGFSQALLEDYSDKLDEQGKDHLQRVHSAAQRMGMLIDDMLSLSRVMGTEMKHELVDLSSLAQSSATELQKSQPERQVKFIITPGVTANGDAHLLRILLENLLGNAWKFTGNRLKARIEFGVTQIDNEQVFFVSDNGAGFDMTYADRLFGVFQRLHATDEFSGTGIGLATVQRIAHRHSGRVWAEGKVDKGATFYFMLG